MRHEKRFTDISVFTDNLTKSLAVDAHECAASCETWLDYYRHEIEGKEAPKYNGPSPAEIDILRPINERYAQIKKYRILLYSEPRRKSVTKNIFDFENICIKYEFPLFFVLDFEEYQALRKWTINGQPIRNVNGAFYRFCIRKRERLKECGAWRGPYLENYLYCGAYENRGHI